MTIIYQLKQKIHAFSITTNQNRNCSDFDQSLKIKRLFSAGNGLEVAICIK